jgi:hypothetical protein
MKVGFWAAVVVGIGATSPAVGAQGAGRWAEAFPAVMEDVRAGRPVVTVVVVPLCSNAQIDCGSGPAGKPGSLETNLYWGAIFGARRFLERKNSGWERVDVQEKEQLADGMLQRAVYRRRVAGEAWGSPAQVEQLLVLEAVHGAKIDGAVDRFWALATGGGRVRFRDGERARDERVHVAGYAGHNRLMDGKKLPAPTAGRAPIPSFVLACYSESYFDGALSAAGSRPLVTTRALMAPEGYVVEAAVRALGDNRSAPSVRDDTVRAYAKWQRLSFGVASAMFSRAR